MLDDAGLTEIGLDGIQHGITGLGDGAVKTIPHTEVTQIRSKGPEARCLRHVLARPISSNREGLGDAGDFVPKQIASQLPRLVT